LWVFHDSSFLIFVDGDCCRVRSGSSEEVVNGNTSLL
jgi:hypothetical protein